MLSFLTHSLSLSLTCCKNSHKVFVCLKKGKKCEVIMASMCLKLKEWGPSFFIE